MDAVSFTNGLSGISTVRSDLVDSDFPKSKSAFKPSGENVIAYTWQALDFDRTFEHREMRFALTLPDFGDPLTPVEHNAMTNRALELLEQHFDKGAEVKNAYDVLQESKELQNALKISRNVLHAA